MTKIIVTSDQHPGYEKSNVDMWRRDASGLFLAFSEIVSKLLKLSITKKIEVYIVAGNHDYHLLKLQNPGYQFKFYEALPDPASPSFATIIKPATTTWLGV